MITRLPRSVLSVVTGLVLATGLFAQAAAQAAAPAAKPASPTIDFPAPSPAATIKQRVGFTDIEIVYSRPSMRGRKIFGGLQPYGEIWRTGANSATKIIFSTPVKFGGADVPAGSYALSPIPGESEWTVILNKVVGQWGAYAYDAKNDVVRVKAVPAKTSMTFETFPISFNDLANEAAATLYLTWENTRVSVKIEVDITSTLVPQIESVLAADTSKKPYFRAAMFYYENNLDLKKPWRGWTPPSPSSLMPTTWSIARDSSWKRPATRPVPSPPPPSRLKCRERPAVWFATNTSA
ncbi:MAG: DUF2911 domain-containing protein [Lacunisphaera sp.]|nr:DUF2911 domain-containing protein [Lacunisphaera sp.]